MDGLCEAARGWAVVGVLQSRALPCVPLSLPSSHALDRAPCTRSADRPPQQTARAPSRTPRRPLSCWPQAIAGPRRSAGAPRRAPALGTFRSSSSQESWGRGIAALSVMSPRAPPAAAAAPPAPPAAPILEEGSGGFGGRRGSGGSGAAWREPSAWPFTRADVELLEGMAAHAAVALRAAQQLEDMSRARRTTAALLDIVQASSSDAGATMQAR